MVTKNKNHTNIANIESVATIIGTTAMLAACMCGLVEHMEREGQHLMTALQPNYSSMSQSASVSSDDTQIRRAGKEEIHHSSASYGSVKRSASVSGAV